MNMDSVKKRTSEDWLLFSSIGWRIFLAVAGSRTFTSNICSWHICAEQSLLVSVQSHNSLRILDWTGRDLGKGSQLAFSASRLTLCSLKKMRNSKVIQEKVFAQRPIMREYLHSIPDFVKWIHTSLILQTFDLEFWMAVKKVFSWWKNGDPDRSILAIDWHCMYYELCTYFSNPADL